MNRVLPFGAILIAICLVFLYIRPAFSGPIAATKTSIASYDAALNAATTYTNKEAELTTESNAISGDSINRLNAFLPDGVDNIQLIIDLNGLAARSNMVLSNFSVGNAPAGGKAASASSTPAAPAALTEPSSLAPSESPVGSLDVTLTATGSYQAFRVFLGAIESSLRPLDVTSLTVHQSNTGIYTYDMTVRIYWLNS